MSWDIFNPEGLAKPSGWTHGLLSPAGGRVLFIAGQNAMDRDGAVQGSFPEQFAKADEVYGASVLRELSAAIERLEDRTYRMRCIEELSISDPRKLDRGLRCLRNL